MGVVLREAPHPHQPVQHAAALVAVDRAQLGKTQGQFPVAPQSRAVDGDVEGAVHRFQEVFLLVHLHRREHPLAIKIEMPAGLPKCRASDVRRIHHVVAAPVVNILPVILDEGADAPALGMPHHQSGADFVVDGVQAQLPAQPAVVAAFCLLQPGQVVVQFLLGLEGRAVNALQHGPLFVAPPVGPGHAEQLECQNIGGIADVRPLAQVNEPVMPVDGYDRRILQPLDEFQLVGLPRKQFLRFAAGQFLPLEWEGAGDGFPHQGFDLLQVIGREGAGDVKIVVETVQGGRPDAHLGFGKQLQDRVGHHVRRRVAHGVAMGVGFADVGVVKGAMVQHDSFLRRRKCVSKSL